MLLILVQAAIKPQNGTHFTRYSPNSNLINSILVVAELDGTEPLASTDYICNTCYKLHVAILKSHENENELADLIQIWEITLSNETSEHTAAVLHSVLFVANLFLNNRAVLLPQVCRVFLQKYFTSDDTLENTEHISENNEGTIKFTSRWMLNQLKLHFNSHMEHKCIHKKFGTILYKKGGDLLTSLSWALGAGTPTKDPEYITTTPNYNALSEEAILAKAGDIINNLVHTEVSRLSNCKYLNTLCFDEQIAKINRSLWMFLEMITRTSRDRQQHKNTGENSRIKRLWCYYLHCLLLYGTNTQQPLPLHLLLADTIEVCGGSRKLMKIFNQLGAVCSPDTHDRFVTEIVSTQRGKTVWDNLPNNTLTIASVDNFDMLQSFAAVYCGD